MKVYRSNRVERLLEALGDVLAVPASSDPLAAEPIVVHGRAMAQWLALRLSERFGVFAGATFPFPRRFIHDTFAHVLGEQASGLSAWDPRQLRWAVLGELPRHLGQPAFAPLQRFLQADPRPRGRVLLCDQLAELFEQYSVFRPDLVAGWDQGRAGDWQADLWRAIRKRVGTPHPAALASALAEAVRRGDYDRTQLPSRVSIFGVSSLPPFYVDVLAALGSILDVHLFLLSPSQGYWADIRSSRDRWREAVSDASVVLPSVEPSEGHPLLASLGRVAGEFQAVLESRASYEEPRGDSLYVEPDRRTLLGALHSDLLHLRGALPARTTIATDDASIRIHACHSPMREVEVLHDQILALVHEHGVAPQDIVVLTPDLETFAPLFQAVFERERGEATFLPCTIADRPSRSGSPVLEGLLRVLAMVGGRLTAPEVLDLLALAPVHARFGIEPADLDKVATWLDEAGIRWGLDARHRAEHGQPRLPEFTWAFGLSRLLVGAAVPGQDRDPFFGVLPYDEIEGTDAELLGRVAALCEALFARLRVLATPQPIPQWTTEIAATLAALFSDHEAFAWEHDEIRAALDELATEATAAGVGETVDAGTIARELQRLLDARREGGGLFVSGITICAMLPMRAVPHAVVCVVGLSDGAFPRREPRLAFDRIAAHPRLGDRSRRSDDRYLFLEALLSARRNLVLTYVGQSVHDNAELAPSVVVDELIDAIAETFDPPGRLADEDARRAAVRDHLVVRHPMQPFSPRVFASEDPRHFGYADAWAAGARAIAEPIDEPSPLFLRGPLATEPPVQVEIAAFTRYLRDPVRELLVRTIGVDFRDFGRGLDHREPLLLDTLQQWRVGDGILAAGEEHVKRTRLRMLAAGGLPMGTVGECTFDALRHSAVVIERAALPWLSERQPDVDVDLEIAGVRLVGRLAPVGSEGQVLVRYGRPSGSRLLEAWILHLVGACAGVPPITRLVERPDADNKFQKEGRPTVRKLRPVEDPHATLCALVELWRMAQSVPIPLFPDPAYVFARALADGEGEAKALGAARRKFADHVREQFRDPHLRRVFGDADPLEAGALARVGLRGPDFAVLARAVFEPILAHSIEESRQG